MALVVRVDFPVLGLPIAQLVVIALLVVACFRRPTRTLEVWFPLIASLLLVFLAVGSLANDISPIQRLGNIAILFTMTAFLASGRIDVASTIKGVAAALVINAGLFFTGIAPDNYNGVLTGFIADKNVAGMFHAVIPLLLFLTVDRSKVLLRAVILIGGAGLLMLTDSRTSMAAFALGVMWLIVARWLGPGLRVLLAGGLLGAFLWADHNLAGIGDYGISRAGSDALREQIDTASRAKAEAAPWYGDGLGTAVVTFESGDRWFFHNSYDALVVEGGIVLLIGMLGLYLLAGVGVFTSTDRDDPRHGVAAAAIVVLLCAFRLGEVFFAPIGLFVIGIGLALTSEKLPAPRPWAAPDPWRDERSLIPGGPPRGGTKPDRDGVVEGVTGSH